MDDPVEEEAESNVEGTGLVSELPLTLQGYRHSKRWCCQKSKSKTIFFNKFLVLQV